MVLKYTMTESGHNRFTLEALYFARSQAYLNMMLPLRYIPWQKPKYSSIIFKSLLEDRKTQFRK